MIRPSRVNQHGRLVPWFADVLRGRQIAEEQGLDLDHASDDDLARLAQAVSDLNPPHPIDPEQEQKLNDELLPILRQIRDEEGGW